MLVRWFRIDIPAHSPRHSPIQLYCIVSDCKILKIRKILQGFEDWTIKRLRKVRNFNVPITKPQLHSISISYHFNGSILSRGKPTRHLSQRSIIPSSPAKLVFVKRMSNITVTIFSLFCVFAFFDVYGQLKKSAPLLMKNTVIHKTHCSMYNRYRKINQIVLLMSPSWKIVKYDIRMSARELYGKHSEYQGRGIKKQSRNSPTA